MYKQNDLTTLTLPMRASLLIHRLSIRIVGSVRVLLCAATRAPTNTPIRAAITGNPFILPLYIFFNNTPTPSAHTVGPRPRARLGAQFWTAFIYMYASAQLARPALATTNPTVCQVRIAQNPDRFRRAAKVSFDAPILHIPTFPPHLCQNAQI